MVVNCPLTHKHTIADATEGDSGPSLAVCVSCEYQQGLNLEILSSDAISADVFPERLVCGAD